eukprot:TRINITY_DN1212_c0_g1_i1.p1 TRINITY_DN1212_c0_g1~~TRINITY_DN1212_c0_g1_i1.p1  ORF type:complete len:133 (+),score=28.43 TRINITY_DN1212_c0_g1_i1:24-422(+)
MMSRGSGSGRSALFDGATPRSTGGKDAMQEDIFLQQNDEQLQTLGAKVAQLKGWTMEINDHIREDNRLLEGLGGDFDRTGGVLQATMGRLKNLVSAKDSRHMIYLVVFIVFVLLLVWYIGTSTTRHPAGNAP